MKKEEIHFGDVNRWLFGQAPPEFLLEVLLRTFIIFLFLLLVIRLMGKRMAGQMTLTEIAVMVTLGAIVSPAMQLPDRGILMGVVALSAALLFQRGLNLLVVQNRRAETLTQGVAAALIKDGKIEVTEMSKARISRQQLFAMLREKKVFNLGQVKRAYLEANGLFTLYLEEKEKPGLSLLPQNETGMDNVLQTQPDHACCNCGHVQATRSKEEPCVQCGAADWSSAFLSKAS